MGFDCRHYVPILKGKQGELNAIQKSDAKLLKNFTPLLEIPPIPPAWPDGEDEPVPAKTIDEHIKTVTKAFCKSLKAVPSLFVDGYYIEPEDDLKDGTSPIDAIFTSLRSCKIPFIPVIGLDRAEDYADSVKRASDTDKRGCCLRLVEVDLEGYSELRAQIDGLLETLGRKVADVDLLIDFGYKIPQKAGLPFLIDALPHLEEWRTFTVASSAFPPNMMEVKTNSIDELEREDWLAWLSLRSKKKAVRRLPTFGDYAINHPVLNEINPKLMQMSPNIRYTDLLNYVVAKGQAQPRKKKNPTPEETAAREKLASKVQYPKLATWVKAHPAWKGTKFSWGDTFIDKCSRKECVGNATDWRAVGTCHHIALVLKQISSLP